MCAQRHAIVHAQSAAAERQQGLRRRARCFYLPVNLAAELSARARAEVEQAATTGARAEVEEAATTGARAEVEEAATTLRDIVGARLGAPLVGAREMGGGS